MVYEAVLIFAVSFFAAWVFYFASGGRDATTGVVRAELQVFILAVLAGYFLWWDPLESTCRHASLSIL